MMMNVENVKATIEFNKKENGIILTVGDKAQLIDAREVETVENVLAMMGIQVQEHLGDILTQSALMMEQYRNDKLYQLGYEAGKKFMEDKIEKHCELGKPVMANEQLYFFKTAQENLRDIMDDLESSFK